MESTEWLLTPLFPGRIGIWKCWFLRREENRSTRRKTLGAGTRANNKLNPHRWEASAPTTAPSLPPCSPAPLPPSSPAPLLPCPPAPLPPSSPAPLPPSSPAPLLPRWMVTSILSCSVSCHKSFFEILLCYHTTRMSVVDGGLGFGSGRLCQVSDPCRGTNLTFELKILSFISHKELYLDIQNGLTIQVCERCHPFQDPSTCGDTCAFILSPTKAACT